MITDYKSSKQHSLNDHEIEDIIIIKTNHYFILILDHGKTTECYMQLQHCYLIYDILDNRMEVAVKIKMAFGKHTFVEDRERRTVKYRPWGKQSKPLIKMETAMRVASLKFRKVRKEPLIQDLHPTLGPGSTWDMVLAIHLQFWLNLIIPRLGKREEKKNSPKSLLIPILRLM